MRVQLKSATLADKLVPRLPIHTYVLLILVFSSAIGLFEAFFPGDFDLVEPLSSSSILKDTIKNIGLVVGFGLSLSFLGRILPLLTNQTMRSARPQGSLLIFLELESWAAIMADALRIIAFSSVLVLFARISIHFGDNPIPLTGQTLAVLLTGAALGSRLGTLSIILYLSQGFAGMHVFAGGGMGLFWNLSSGGYLVGFVATAFLVGLMVERGWNVGPRLLLALLVGNVALYIPGLIQLALFVGWDKTLVYGLYPFIPGDLAKLYIASLLVPSTWALVDFRRKELMFWR